MSNEESLEDIVTLSIPANTVQLFTKHGYNIRLVGAHKNQLLF